MNKIVMFLNEVKSELFKITWPRKDEVIGLTIIICIFVMIAAVMLGGMDAVFSHLIKRIIGS